MTPKQKRIDDAISRLCEFIPYGELLAATEPDVMLNGIANLLARREKQLKRVIESARAWMESERACSREYDELLDDHAWHRWPEEPCETDKLYLVALEGDEESPAIAYLSDFSRHWAFTNGDRVYSIVTHWRELPPGPENV